MTHGAHTPLTRARPDQPANLTDQTAGPDPVSANACQPPHTRRHTKPLEQAGSRHGEWMRLAGFVLWSILWVDLGDALPNTLWGEQLGRAVQRYGHGGAIQHLIEERAPHAALRAPFRGRQRVRRRALRTTSPDPRLGGGEDHIESPYDVEARYRAKSEMSWTGYMVHLTETCDLGAPRLVIRYRHQAHHGTATLSLRRKARPHFDA